MCAQTSTIPRAVSSATPAATNDVVGVIYGIAAYGFWGLVPIYFKAVSRVSPWEVLAHRVVWSLVFLVLLTLVRRNWRAVANLARQKRAVATLALTTTLIACNWFIFIWAVANDHLVQASLGYFINPLVNVLLGFIFLGERLRRWQTVSVILAGVGVGYLTLQAGQFPYIALVLAFSFGFYGLLRKKLACGAVVGLTVETALLTPAAATFLIFMMIRGDATFAAESFSTDLLLMAAGLVTALPLLWFAAAVPRLRLATLGCLQYLAPTGHFLLAVLAFGEPFTTTYVVTFACIWTALLIYSVEGAAHTRRPRSAPPPPAVE